MRRKLLLGMALVAAGALLFPVTAAPNGGGDTLVDSEGTATNITLEPADGPNGKYAVVEDGEIALQFSPVENTDLELGDGINAEGRHVFDSVFVIDNAGNVTAESLYITDDADDVQFFRGDDPGDVIEGQDNDVTLPGGEEMHVGVVIDATGDPESISRFTVHAEGGGDGSEGKDEDDGNDAGDRETGEGGTGLGSTGDEGSGTDDEETDDEETSDDEETDDEQTDDETSVGTGGGDGDGVTGGDTGSVGDQTDGDGGESQQGSVVRPFLPVPEVTLGGFLLRTLLLLVLFVAAGTGTFAVARRLLGHTGQGG